MTWLKPQFRGRKENIRQAEESVEFWQEQETRRTGVTCKRKADTRIFKWLQEKVDMSSLEEGGLDEWDGEGVSCGVFFVGRAGKRRGVVWSDLCRRRASLKSV